MENKASVSIVLCTYNGEKYVREQIDSLLAQSYPIQEIIIKMMVLRIIHGRYYKRMHQNMLLFVLLRMKANMVLMRTSFLHCIVQQVITLPFLTKMISGRGIR